MFQSITLIGLSDICLQGLREIFCIVSSTALDNVMYLQHNHRDERCMRQQRHHQHLKHRAHNAGRVGGRRQLWSYQRYFSDSTALILLGCVYDGMELLVTCLRRRQHFSRNGMVPQWSLGKGKIPLPKTHLIFVTTITTAGCVKVLSQVWNFLQGTWKKVLWVYFLQSVHSYTWCSVSPTLQFHTMCNLTCDSTCIS